MRPALYENAANMAAFVDGFFPPDFYEWPTLLEEMIITVQIAIWGTVLSVVCAIPSILPRKTWCRGGSGSRSG